MTSVIEDPSTNSKGVSYKRNQAKAKSILFYFVKYHLMLVIIPLNISKEFFDTLVKLFEAKAPSQKRTLKDQICTLKIEKDDIVASLFTKISTSLQLLEYLLKMMISCKMLFIVFHPLGRHFCLLSMLMRIILTLRG